MSLCPFPPFLVFLGGSAAAAVCGVSPPVLSGTTWWVLLADRVGARMLCSFSQFSSSLWKETHAHAYTKGNPQSTYVIVLQKTNLQLLDICDS